MRGILYIQLNDKGKHLEKPEPLECEIDLDKNGYAIAGVDRRVVASLKRAHVEFISANGLLISGVIESSYDPFPVLRYQEWWFVPKSVSSEVNECNVSQT